MFGLGNWTHLCKVIKHVQYGPKRLKLEQDRFGTGFVFDKPNDFVRISDSAEIQAVWEPNLSCPKSEHSDFRRLLYIFFSYI